MVHRHFYCPYCNTHLDYKIGYGDSDVGPSKARCPSCGKEYLTGLSEWKEKTKWQKLKYFLLAPWRLLGQILTGGVLGFIVMSGISYFFFDNALNTYVVLGGIGIFMAAFVFFWWKELREDTSNT